MWERVLSWFFRARAEPSESDSTSLERSRSSARDPGKLIEQARAMIREQSEMIAETVENNRQLKQIADYYEKLTIQQSQRIKQLEIELETERADNE